jgi:hypothetical protein
MIHVLVKLLDPKLQLTLGTGKGAEALDGPATI